MEPQTRRQLMHARDWRFGIPPNFRSRNPLCTLTEGNHRLSTTTKYALPYDRIALVIAETPNYKVCLTHR
jgi:hypothetical protein